MAALYSQIERDMHSCLMSGEKINVVEKSLQSKYKVDSTTVRNAYHNLKGKHSGIKELRKTQTKDLKGTIRSIQNAIKKRQKKKQLSQKDRAFIHQKKRRLAIKIHKLEKLSESRISLCFGTKKLFKAQYHLEENGYSNHEEWLADWRAARTSNLMMVGSKTYASGNQLCRLNSDGQLTITTPLCLLKQFGSHVKCEDVKFNYGQTFVDIAAEKECPIVIEKLDFSSKKSRLREHSKRYAKMLSQFAYSKFSDLVHSKARLSAIQALEVNPAYSSLIGMTKYMSLYGLNSGTSAALVLARRSFRFSERLPRCLNASISPVDDNKHVWHYWARTSKLLKGCYRHSFFNVRVRFGVGGNAAVSAAVLQQSSAEGNPPARLLRYSTPTRRVKPHIQSSCEKRKILGKCKHTPIIPSYPLRLGSCLLKFA